jgi:hypothetical protein
MLHFGLCQVSDKFDIICKTCDRTFVAADDHWVQQWNGKRMPWPRGSIGWQKEHEK